MDLIGFALVKKLAVGVSVISSAVTGASLFWMPPTLDKILNRTYPHKFEPGTRTLVQPSAHARELHKTLTVIDLHADSLLWGRNLAVRSSHGHIDVPRLIEGNVALQVFTTVTKVPVGVNIRKNPGRSDLIGLLAVAEMWPVKSWNNLKERVLHQANRLKKLESDSKGRFTFIKSARDLDAYLLKRTSDPAQTAGILGVEGAHALNGDLENIDVFYNHGVRLMAPTHFFDNEIGGSAHGWKKGGLTEKGKQMIKLMEAKSMIVDLAHASPTVMSDTLTIATKPVLVSHTGVKGTCDNERNISDEQIKAVAKNGGVIGIGFWKTAVCGKDAKAIARAIRYTADLAGVEHVGLGSDFDGAVKEPFDSSEYILLTDALINEGFSDSEIRSIMGGNALRLLKAGLPRQ